MIRVLLVDDQALFREGLETLLSVQSNIKVVGQAANGLEAVTKAADLQPDVVLMDLRMPKLNGVMATERLLQVCPDCQVIILTTFDDDQDIFGGVRAGAVGYLLKDISADKLVEAIRAAAQGQTILQPDVATKVISQFSRLANQLPEQQESLIEPLSNREEEVLTLLAAGKTNREIAEELFIAYGTVKNHVTSILRKMNVNDRTQAALRARELGLL